MKHNKFLKWFWLSEEGSLVPRKEKRFQDAIAQSTGYQEGKEQIEKLCGLLSGLEYNFRPGFSERTMTRIRTVSASDTQPEFFPDLPAAFRWVTLAGVAALALIVFSYYFSGGSWSMESFFGTRPFSDDALISYLLYQN